MFSRPTIFGWMLILFMEWFIKILDNKTTVFNHDIDTLDTKLLHTFSVSITKKMAKMYT